MHLPTPRPINAAQLYVSGDVAIDPSAALAPGVILQAAAHSQIKIGPGVCLGMGVILNAYHGAIVIEAGVSLGPGVLIVGAGTIGHNACVGAVTTIFNTSVPALQVIPAGSILGDPTRKVEGFASDNGVSQGPTFTAETVTNGSAPGVASNGQIRENQDQPNPVQPNPVQPEPSQPEPVKPPPDRVGVVGDQFVTVNGEVRNIPGVQSLNFNGYGSSYSPGNTPKPSPSDAVSSDPAHANFAHANFDSVPSTSEVNHSPNSADPGEIKTEALEEELVEPETTTPEPETIGVEQPKNAPIFGQTYVNQLMVTIFPNREN